MAISYIPEQKQYKKLTPFKRYVLQSFPWIDEDFDALTNKQLLAKVIEYLNDVIANGETLQENVESLYNGYVELYNYINNLDVQDEINNKLDSMVQDGTMGEIINQEIFGDITNSIGDINNLTTPTKNNLVNAINTNNQANEIYLGNGIFYDIPQDVGHVQGSCIHGNNLYVAVQGEGTYGYIYVFNIVTNTYVSRFENVTMYHGNDLTYLNDKIYIASVDSLALCIYDINNNSTIVVNPFSELTSNYDELVGVEKLDENHILCWLKNTNGANTIANDKFVKLNINSMQYEDFAINNDFKLLNANGNVTRQNMTIDGNKIYILMQVPQIIYKGIIENNTIKFVKIYNLPYRDLNNNPITEFESLAIIDNPNYPKGSIMLTTRSFETLKDTNQQYNEDTICNYFFSIETGDASYVISHNSLYAQRGTNSFGYNSVSKSVGNLIECGSSVYPFKNLMRAINCAVGGKYSPTNIQIIDSSTYYLPYVYGISKVQIDIQRNCNPTIYIGDIENSDISFLTRGNATLTIRPINANKRISIINSNISFYADTSQNIIFNELQLMVSKLSTLKTRRCKFLNTEEVSSHKAIDVNDGSFAELGFDNFTVHSNDKKIGFGGVAFVVTNVESSSIIHSGVGAMITMTIN